MPAADGEDAYRGPPIASWCKVRPGRFFWGVWSSRDPHREAPPIACGFEPNHEAAKGKAEAAAGPRGRVDSSYAGIWHAWNRDVLRPHFARCRIGDGRGYWVAWRWFDARTGQHGEATSGVAADLDAAEAAARAFAGPDAVDLGSKIASAHRRGEFQPERPAGPLSRLEADAFTAISGGRFCLLTTSVPVKAVPVKAR